MVVPDQELKLNAHISNFTLGKPNLYIFAQNIMNSTAPRVSYSIKLVAVIIYIKKISSQPERLEIT